MEINDKKFEARFQSYLKSAKAMKLNNQTREDILRKLRDDGANKLESMRVLARLEGLDLGEAKKIVHFSETWKDVQQSDEQLIEDFERVAREHEHRGHQE
jgi:ribosomal protein L7/L12